MTTDAQAHIGSVNSTIRAVDGSPLSPAVMQQIIQTVLQAVEEEAARRERIDGERRVTPGVAYDLEREER
jgi:hypothetical protein